MLYALDERVVPQPQVRLVQGNQYSGRVQLLHRGTWGAVCGDGWSLEGATVVCKQLGFPGALQSLSKAEFGEILPDEKVWWTGFGCSGNESSISDCLDVESLSDEQSCSFNSPAGVICEGKLNTLLPRLP